MATPRKIKKTQVKSGQKNKIEMTVTGNKHDLNLSTIYTLSISCTWNLYSG